MRLHFLVLFILVFVPASALSQDLTVPFSEFDSSSVLVNRLDALTYRVTKLSSSNESFTLDGTSFLFPGLSEQTLRVIDVNPSENLVTTEIQMNVGLISIEYPLNNLNSPFIYSDWGTWIGNLDAVGYTAYFGDNYRNSWSLNQTHFTIVEGREVIEDFADHESCFVRTYTHFTFLRDRGVADFRYSEFQALCRPSGSVTEFFDVIMRYEYQLVQSTFSKGFLDGNLAYSSFLFYLLIPISILLIPLTRKVRLKYFSN